MLNQLQGAAHASDSQLQALIGAAGVGVFVSAPGAAGTKIQNNLIGLAPDGKRTGSLADPNGNYGNTFGIAIIPIGGNVHDVTVGGDTEAEGNVISGNFIGMLATGADNLAVFNNLVGPGPDKKSVGPAPFGNSMGMMVVGKGSAIQVGKPGAGNKIQGNFMGLVAGGPAGMKIQSNDIGVDQTLLGFGQDLQAAIAANQAPTMGLHNMLGAMLVGTQGTLLGGSRAAGEGNKILGDITGVFLGGPGSANNRVMGNDIGTSKKPVKAIQKLKASDMGGIVGLILAAGSGAAAWRAWRARAARSGSRRWRETARDGSWPPARASTSASPATATTSAATCSGSSTWRPRGTSCRATPSGRTCSASRASTSPLTT